MFEKNDEIRVIANYNDPIWNMLIGCVGTVIDVNNDNRTVSVQFDYDADWAEHEFDCMFEEIELTGNVNE